MAAKVIFLDQNCRDILCIGQSKKVKSASCLKIQMELLQHCKSKHKLETLSKNVTSEKEWVKLPLGKGRKNRKATLKMTFSTGSAFLFIVFPFLFVLSDFYLLIFSLAYSIVKHMLFNFYLFITLFSQLSSFI